MKKFLSKNFSAAKLVLKLAEIYIFPPVLAVLLIAVIIGYFKLII